MPTPDFILTLRERVGHDLLWLTGVTAVVVDADERVLLTRRADTGAWALVSGILEPGEQPAPAIVREIGEETGIEAVVERLASVEAQEPITYPGGDTCQFLDLCFRCRHVRGEPRVGDDENLDVGWFALDRLPPLSASVRRRLDLGLVREGPPEFRR